jgi:hypothetical protein
VPLLGRREYAKTDFRVGRLGSIIGGRVDVRHRPKAAVPRPGLSVRLCARLLAGRGKDKLWQKQ